MHQKKIYLKNFIYTNMLSAIFSVFSQFFKIMNSNLIKPNFKYTKYNYKHIYFLEHDTYKY